MSWYDKRLRQRRISAGLLGIGAYMANGFSPSVALDFVKRKYYAENEGGGGITSSAFDDLLTFTAPAGRTYTNAAGDTVTAGLNEPRIGNHIDTGGGLFNAGILMDSASSEVLGGNPAPFARAIGSPGPELWDDADVYADPLWSESNGVYTKSGTGNAVLGLTTLSANAYYVKRFRVMATSGLLNVWRRNATDTGNEQVASNLGTGVYDLVLKAGPAANPNGTYLWFDGNSFIGTVEELSMAEVSMPAELSGAMSMFISYTDLDAAGQLTIYDHRVDANNRMTVTLDTDGANTGLFTFAMVNGGSLASVSSAVQIAPGVNVSAKVAWYATASGINIALNGNSSTEVATAIGVPDLIAESVKIVEDGTMNIGEIPIWDESIESDGIVEVTT